MEDFRDRDRDEEFNDKGRTGRGRAVTSKDASGSWTDYDALGLADWVALAPPVAWGKNNPRRDGTRPNPRAGVAEAAVDSVDLVTDGWVRWITRAQYLVYSPAP